MFDMANTGNPVFLQIQNSKKPDQIISVVMSDSEARFETQGLRGFFGLEEISIERTEFLLSMEEFATLLSHLFETMSTAQDLNLPYGYMDSFEYKGRRYSLRRQDGYRVLTKQDQP
jgi:hypothetical protein